MWRKLMDSTSLLMHSNTLPAPPLTRRLCISPVPNASGSK